MTVENVVMIKSALNYVAFISNFKQCIYRYVYDRYVYKNYSG